MGNKKEDEFDVPLDCWSCRQCSPNWCLKDGNCRGEFNTCSVNNICTDSTRLVSDKKPAQQSTTKCVGINCGVASLALDEWIGSGHVSETENEGQNKVKWYGDLVDTVKIDHVDVIGSYHDNCCIEDFSISFYLKGTLVKVEENALFKKENLRYGDSNTYFASVLIQPYVVADRVQLERRSKLRMGDVRVYGDVCGPTRTNIALNPIRVGVGQSTTQGVYEAKKALDGNVLPGDLEGTLTEKEEEPYWHVTLPDNYLIDTVVVWRKASPNQKLYGPVGDDFVTGAHQTNFFLKEQCVNSSSVTYDSGIDDSYTTISIDPPISADKVEIRAYYNKQTKMHLILGEVQVYGYDRNNPTCPGRPLLEGSSPSPSQVSLSSTPTVQNLSDKIVGAGLIESSSINCGLDTCPPRKLVTIENSIFCQQDFSRLFDGDRFTNAGCAVKSYLMVQLKTKVKIRFIQLVGVSIDPNLGPFLSGKCTQSNCGSSFVDNPDPDRWPEEEGTMYCDYGSDGLVDDSILIIFPGGSSILGDIIVWGEPLPQIEHECDFTEDCDIGNCYETLQFEGAGRKCLILAAAVTVKQTSNYFSHGCKEDMVPEKAIDRNTDGEFSPGCSIAHTKPEYTPKWTATLSNNYFIYGIMIWRRTDTYLKQLNGVYIAVYDELDTIVYKSIVYEYGPLNGVTSDSSLNIPFPVQAIGNRVEIYKKNNGEKQVLSLVEVEILVSED